MYSLTSLRQARNFSATLLRSFSHHHHHHHVEPVKANLPGYLENLKRGTYSYGSVARVGNEDRMPRVVGNWGMNLCSVSTNGNAASAPYALSFRNSFHSTYQKDFETGRNSKPMDFVRGVIEEDGKGFIRPHFPRYNVEQNADFVHIKLMRNNTFVTVTDSKGNKKIGASSGCLPELKGGPKMSRYAAEATAEHVGRLTRNMGLRSVVMRVKGFTYFKKKRQAIMSFREGFSNSRDQNPIVYIEDTTRKPHNGCRLRKKRRI